MSKNINLTCCLLFAFIRISYAQPGNTGSAELRKKVAVTYSSQIGVRELTGKNDGTAVEMYLRYCGLSKGEPWCASFVCWSLGQNKITNPRNGYCPALFSPKRRVWQRNQKVNNTPLQGDVWGLYFPDKKRIAHVGFVDVWGSKTVITVEGNTNQAGSREGDGVYRKIRLTRQIYEVTRFIH